MQDPFYVVRDEVQQAVRGVESLHVRWRQLLETTNTAQNDEFSWTTEELKKGLRSIEYDLTDLADTIAVVEANTSKFHIDAAEVASRKGFVDETREKVRAVEADMKSEQATGKQHRDGIEALKSAPNNSRSGRRGDTSDRLQEAIRQDNTDFVHGQQQQQEQIVRQQDDGLVQLGSVVGNLKEIGVAINDELEQQATIIDELDAETERANTGVMGLTRKVSELIDKQKEGTQWCIIIVLIVVLVTLVVVATQLP